MSTTLAPARKQLVALMQKTVDDQAKFRNWDYRAVRPQYIHQTYVPGLHVDSDCSDGCRSLCRWANIVDPAGNGYAPYGNSSSIFFHLHHAPLEDAEPGDIYTFGYSTGEKHACMAFDTEPDPTVWNMGTQGQPVLRKLSQEAAAHSGMTVTLCKIPVVDPPPTAEDKLRAMQGFYSWVAWRLGEGPWKHYGGLNKTVRPNVPKLISPSWWKQLVVFLANRKKATG